MRILEHMGWERVSQEGSHVKLSLPDGRNPVIVPDYRGQIKPGTLGSILRQAGLTSREFQGLAEEIL
jgi:predicted RNA binding protein YcfA (HicA-like mRNA interferase family)